jgi:2-polyprenyl-3-methyl-5-hydroxy-6-metoxy-1,4-benzoquinol methylase
MTNRHSGLDKAGERPTVARPPDIGYRWSSAEPTCANEYIMPAVRRALAGGLVAGRARRAFDLGCGNGATARTLAAEGWQVAGIDPSQEGIAHAKATGLDLRLGSAYDDLVAEFGQWPFVLCLEVVEHVYFPHRLARTLYDLCEPGGWRSCPLPTTAIGKTCR